MPFYRVSQRVGEIKRKSYLVHVVGELDAQLALGWPPAREQQLDHLLEGQTVFIDDGTMQEVMLERHTLRGAEASVHISFVRL